MRIQVRLAAEEAMLSVSDDGVGLPAGAGPARNSLGLQIVRLLAEQIGATVEMQSRDGVRVVVSRPATPS